MSSGNGAGLVVAAIVIAFAAFVFPGLLLTALLLFLALILFALGIARLVRGEGAHYRRGPSYGPPPGYPSHQAPPYATPYSPPYYPPPQFLPGRTVVPGPPGNPPLGFAAPPPVPQTSRFCPACGSPNLRGSAFCHRCGQPLPPSI